MIFLLKVLLINDQLALAPNISYDNGFNTRFSLNLTYQFGTTSDTFSSLRSNNRDIRVYDPTYVPIKFPPGYHSIPGQGQKGNNPPF